jgi:hypothetical protein
MLVTAGFNICSLKDSAMCLLLIFLAAYSCVVSFFLTFISLLIAHLPCPSYQTHPFIYQNFLAWARSFQRFRLVEGWSTLSCCPCCHRMPNLSCSSVDRHPRLPSKIVDYEPSFPAMSFSFPGTMARPPQDPYNPPQDTYNDAMIAEILGNDPTASLPFDAPITPPDPRPTPKLTTNIPRQHDTSTEFEDLQMACVLSASLAVRTISDVPLGLRPLSHPVECIACTETLPPPSFPSRPITDACNHTPPDRMNSRICLTCLSEHLRVQLESNGPNALACPICHARLQHEDVHQWASAETFRRFDDLTMRAAAQTDDDWVECSAGCGTGQFHTGGAELPIVICQGCGARTCFVHQNTRWHEGLTCYEFDNPAAAEERRRTEAAEEEEVRRRVAEEEGREEERKREEAARKRRQEEELAKIRAAEEERARRRREEEDGETEVKASSKPCPGKRCAYRVTKLEGCKHITCTRCRHEWCWICLKPWSTGHLSVVCS